MNFEMITCKHDLENEKRLNESIYYSVKTAVRMTFTHNPKIYIVCLKDELETCDYDEEYYKELIIDTIKPNSFGTIFVIGFSRDGEKQKSISDYITKKIDEYTSSANITTMSLKEIDTDKINVSSIAIPINTDLNVSDLINIDVLSLSEMSLAFPDQTESFDKCVFQKINKKIFKNLSNGVLQTNLIITSDSSKVIADHTEFGLMIKSIHVYTSENNLTTAVETICNRYRLFDFQIYKEKLDSQTYKIDLRRYV